MRGPVHSEQRKEKKSWLAPGWRLVFLGSLAVAAFFLLTEHRAHLYGALPYVLVALFIGLHLFGHGRHGRHAGPGPGGERP